MEIFGNLIAVDAVIKAIGIALLSGVLHGYSGFGGALLMIPLLSLFIEPAYAVAATMISAFIGQIPLTWQAARLAQWKECGPFLIAAIIAMPAGVYLLIAGDANVVRGLVGIGTIIMASVLLAGWAYRGNRSLAASAFFGGLIGMFGGATGQGGPIAVAYFIAAPVGAELQRANIITVLMGMTVFVLAGLAVGGILTSGIMLFGIALGIPFTLATWIGSRLFSVVPLKHYKPVIVFLLFVAGVSALFKQW